MNAQEAAHETAEVVTAKEIHRVEVLAPKQIDLALSAIKTAVDSGLDYAWVNDDMYPETKGYLRSLGYYVNDIYQKISWGPNAEYRKSQDTRNVSVKEKPKFFARLFGCCGSGPDLRTRQDVD